MRSGSWAFAAVLLASSVLGADAQAIADPEVGMMTPDGHIFLYREPVEEFWNDWTGMRVNNPKSKQADVYIKSEGKTAGFNGILSLHCPQGWGHVWIAGAFGIGQHPRTEEFYDETIPKVVVAQARRFFCNTE